MTNLGATPFSHPIRKRAWWKALRAGKLWLILPYSEYNNYWKGKFGHILLNNTYTRILFDKNCPMTEGYIMWPWKDSEMTGFEADEVNSTETLAIDRGNGGGGPLLFIKGTK